MEPAEIARLIAPVETRRMVRAMAFSPTARFEGVGDALLRLDSQSDAIYPSQNLNNVWNLGVESEPNEGQIAEIIARYRAEKIRRFFFYLSPGPFADRIAGWLVTQEFKVRNELAVLFGAARTDATPQRETDLTVRRIEPSRAETLLAQSSPIDSWPAERWEQALLLVKRPEFDVFLAFDGETPVASGLLCTDGELGWLGMAATLPTYRGRGAQNALIAARIRRAAERGCRYIYAETYREILNGSFRNLERGGLTAVYARPIYARR